MKVHIAQADIATLAVDAIVNPSNSQGSMDRGIGRMLCDQGGEDIHKAVSSKAPIAVGAAVVTHAGTLPAKFVIHVPTMPTPDEQIGVEHVRRATRAALLAADASKFQVIGIPGIGTHVGGVAVEESARAIVEEIRTHKKALPETIYLVDASPDMMEAFEDALRAAQIGH